MVIEKALDGFKTRIREKSISGRGGKPLVDFAALLQVLEEYDTTASEQQLDLIVTSSSNSRKWRPRGRSLQDEGADVMEIEEDNRVLLTFDDLLTSTTFWDIIMVS